GVQLLGRGAALVESAGSGKRYSAVQGSAFRRLARGRRPPRVGEAEQRTRRGECKDAPEVRAEQIHGRGARPCSPKIQERSRDTGQIVPSDSPSRAKWKARGRFRRTISPAPRGADIPLRSEVVADDLPWRIDRDLQSPRRSPLRHSETHQ